MIKLFKKLISEEDGQGMVEYGLIIALVAVVAMGALVAMRGGLESVLNSIATSLNDPGSVTGS